MTKFEFDEIVRIFPKAQSNAAHLHNTLGVISGKTSEEDINCRYGVAIDNGKGILWMFDEDELESTGEFMEPGYEMTDTTVRVSVDKDGKGTLVGEVKEDGTVIPIVEQKGKNSKT